MIKCILSLKSLQKVCLRKWRIEFRRFTTSFTILVVSKIVLRPASVKHQSSPNMFQQTIYKTNCCLSLKSPVVINEELAKVIDTSHLSVDKIAMFLPKALYCILDQIAKHLQTLLFTCSFSTKNRVMLEKTNHDCLVGVLTFLQLHWVG